MRAIGSVAALAMLTACACALDEQDKTAGKPSLWQCIAASGLKGAACNQDDGDGCN